MSNKKSSFWYVLVDSNGDIFGNTESDFVEISDNSFCAHFRKALKAENDEILSGFTPNQLRVFRDINAFLNNDSLESNTPLFDFGKDSNIPMVVQLPTVNTNKRAHITKYGRKSATSMASVRAEFVSESSIRHGDTSSLYSGRSNRSSLQNVYSSASMEERTKEPIKYLANDGNYYYVSDSTGDLTEEQKPYIRGYKFNDVKGVVVAESKNQTKTFKAAPVEKKEDYEEFHNFEVIGQKSPQNLVERASSFGGTPAKATQTSPITPLPSLNNVNPRDSPTLIRNIPTTPAPYKFEKDPSRSEPNVQKNEDSSAPTVYSFQKVQKAVEDIPVPQPAKNIFTEDVDPALLVIDEDKPFIKGYAFD